MSLDPVLLSRLQWAWVIALAHPAAGLHRRPRLLHRGARRPLLLHRTGIWFRISSFWTRIFAVSFGMGVVSGIIMPFQFGTNWSRFSDATANVLSPLLAYEGLMAFFLEASFLGVLLFGRRLVPRWAHFFAALMVAFGTLLSSFWILVGQQLDADPRRLQDRRRPVFPGRLARDRLQSVVPLSARAQRHGILHHDGASSCSGVGAYLLRRGKSTDEARADDQDGTRPADRAGAAADRARRPARPQHAALPAGQARRDRGPLRYRAADAADPVRHPRRQDGDDARRHRDSRPRQPDPDPFAGTARSRG